MDVEALPTAADDLGEGPLWEPETGALWWVDITGRSVRCRDLAGGLERRWATPSNVGCLALTQREDLLIALADGVHRLDPASGAITRQSADPEPDLPTVFNDGWVDPGGRLWCGTADEIEQRPRGSLYRFDPDGTWTRDLGEAPVEVISVANGRVRMSVRPGPGTSAERAGVALDAARRAGPVNHFAFDRRSLAEVFLSIVGRPADAAAEEVPDAGA